MLSTSVVTSKARYPNSASAAFSCQSILPDHPQRALIEHFICAKYWLSFAACLQQLPYHLIAVFEHQQPVAACALTAATEQPLFCETYLSQPAQQLIATATNTTIERQHLIEVGSMACVDHRYLPVLFAAIIEATAAAQRPWLVFTATSPLRRHLKRFDLPTLVLGEAHSSALPQAQHQQWGRYYATQPVVVAGHIDQGRTLVTQLAPQLKRASQ